MDPKQTEGQKTGSSASQGGFSFSSGQPTAGFGTTGAATGTPGVTNSAGTAGTSNAAGATNPLPTPPTPPSASAAMPVNSTAPNILSTGANVSRAMSDLNSNSRKSSTVNSPFAKHRFNKVAPQTGDILIDPSGQVVTSGPKQGINRGRLIQFGLIFGGIAFVALVIFTVVLVINNNNKPKETTPSTPQVVIRPVEETFPEYMNMFISSTGEVADLDSIWEYYLSFYPSTYAIKQMDSPASANRTDYFEQLNKKWNEFILGYEGKYAGTASIGDIPFYFYNVALLPDLNEQTLYSLYTGYDQKLVETKNTVADLTKNNTTSFAIASLLEMKKNLYDATLDVINDAKNVGCLTAETLFHACDASALPTYANYQKALEVYNTEFTKRVNAYRDFAINSLTDICTELLGTADTNDTTSANNSNTVRGDSR